MKQDYVIGVFTRGRVNTQFFLESLPEVILGVITIFCHPGERQAHLKRWGGKVADVVEYGKDCTNLGQARAPLPLLFRTCRPGSRTERVG